MVVSFGNMFNNIRLVRYNKAGTIEIERITVPLSYAPKEKFYTRITQDPTLNREVEIILPRMSFELAAIAYDPLRKISSFQNQYSPDNAVSAKSAYQSPYNFSFNLNIYVRNTEDGTQIVEQILPYFNPDYTVTINIADIGPAMDVPIILESVSYDVSNDTGDPDSQRIIIWNLTFTAKGYLYGPINSGASNKLIRKAIANTYLDGTKVPVERKISLSSGFGDYKTDELVFEGNKLEEANATAFVRSWDPLANNLVVYDINGIFNTGFKIKGVITNASYLISTVENNVNQASYIAIYPNPLSANSTDDYGFTEVHQSFPYLGLANTSESTLLSTDNDNLSTDNLE